jgi:outer membrane protein assembly factor BamB
MATKMLLASTIAAGLYLGAGIQADGAIAGWRHDGAGSFAETTASLAWSGGSNAVWATALPQWSNASPVLAGKRIFICSEPSTLLCLSREDGTILWQHDNGYADVLPAEEAAAYTNRPKTHDANGYTSATPVTDGTHVYVLFGTGVAACYDMDGKRLWARVMQIPKHDWGFCSSPLLAGQRLLIFAKDVEALDPATGKTVWSAPTRARWGTPAVARIGDDDVLVTPCGDVLKIADGKVVASQVSDLEYSSPVIVKDIAYFIENGGKAVRLPASLAGEPRFEAQWTTTPPKDRYYASPVIHDGLIYTINRRNAFSVIDAASGAVVYTKELDLGGGDVFPSVSRAGERIYVSNSNGSTIVLKTGREYAELARNKLEPFRSSLVFDDAHMYVRTAKHLYCIGK